MSDTIKVLAKRLNRPSAELLELLEKNGTPKSSEEDELTPEEAVKLVELAVDFESGGADKVPAVLSTPKTLGVTGTTKPLTMNKASASVVTRRRGKTAFRANEVRPTETPRVPLTTAPSRAERDAVSQDFKNQVQRIREEEDRKDAARQVVREAKMAEERKREAARLEQEERRKEEAEKKAELREEKLRSEEAERRKQEEAERVQAEQKLVEKDVEKRVKEADKESESTSKSIEDRVRDTARRRERMRQRLEAGDDRIRKAPRKGVGQGRRQARLRRPTVDQGGTFEKPQFVQHEVEIGETIVLGQLAHEISVKAGDVIKQLMGMGVMATVNQVLDQDTAVLIVEEFGHKARIVEEQSVEEKLQHSLEIEGELAARSPVVTVMGHVDHGKTSLLDYIRKTRVASGEAGGITQHIGAYHLTTDHGEITFLDTPGHAAFSAMRARGANATDIVVLVCAANDGVMPQTEEAVRHAQAAEVPIIVAVNKMDLHDANPDLVKNGLAALGVTPEEWGGENQFIEVSAETGQGIEDLLEAISLQADLLELKAVEEAPARGVVIEAKVERGRGPVASLLVQSGTLKQSDVVIAGEHYGKVRLLSSDQGKKLKTAGPSIPVEMLGLNGSPSAGDAFLVAANERLARQIAEERLNELQAKQHAQQRAAQIDNIFTGLGQGEKRILKIIMKADVRGSLEAITQACADLGNEEVSVQILGSGVGGINESDVNMAITYGALIFGFNVRTDKSAKVLTQKNQVEVRYYNVIYELLEDLEGLLTDMLVPEQREEIVGTAEVRDVFRSPRFGQIAGCMVVEGTVSRNKKIRVLRDSTVIFEGELESLRRFQDDVNEVRFGLECGIGVRNYNDVRTGDMIEVYQTSEVARTL